MKTHEERFCIGKKFGRYTVLSFEYKDKNNKPMVTAQCDCGIFKIVGLAALKCGNTKSCGCYISEITSLRNTTHNLSHSREYRAWADAKARCSDTKGNRWKNYGSRGITFCERWGNSFELFLEDMGAIPSKNLTLERIDNNKGYSPDNCRWATKEEQTRNRRCNRLVEYQDQKLTISEWASKLEIPKETIYYRANIGITDPLLLLRKKIIL